MESCGPPQEEEGRLTESSSGCECPGRERRAFAFQLGRSSFISACVEVTQIHTRKLSEFPLLCQKALIQSPE